MPGVVEKGNSRRGRIDDIRVAPEPGANFPLELRRIPALDHICDVVPADEMAGIQMRGATVRPACVCDSAAVFSRGHPDWESV